MKLKLCARKDYVVNARPGWIPPHNGHVPRINRARPTKTEAGFAEPALSEPFECELDSKVGRYVLKLFSRRDAKKDPPLWPADQATATALGTKYTPIEFKNGEWIEAKKKPAPPVREGDR